MMNLLFIMFDDLRPELTMYSRPHMINPNFERLANRSVIFDSAFAQIAVCNPSRDSMLTGLRPDTVGTYSFQSSFRPHMIIQNQLVKAGYDTAGYGKIAHWETSDKEIWSVDAYEGDWYSYQNRERNFMNSSTMPDKVWPDEKFRDYIFASRAVDRLDKMLADRSKKFMLGIGFKNPHLQIHIPYEYYELYKNRTDAFKLTKKELRFPHSTPDVAYRCCAEPSFMYMNEEGAKRASNVIQLGDINMVIADKMREEMMLGYCAAITFVDKQLGRILDVMDKHDGWKDTVVVLTADHGMHNGEKGIWEKWSMFDESTRIPLFIYHPQTPFAGQHYPDPVELIDVYPTVVDLLAAPYTHSTTCEGFDLFFGKKKVCHNLQGKSLARVILGDSLNKKLVESSSYYKTNRQRMPIPTIGDNGKKDGQQNTYGQLLNVFPTRRNLRHFSIDHNQDVSYDDVYGYYYQLMMLLGNATSSTVYDRVTGDMITTNHSYVFNYEDHLKSANPLSDINQMFSSHRQLSDTKKTFEKNSSSPVMPRLDQTFAISQSWRCAKINLVKKASSWHKEGGKGARPRSQWFDCDKVTRPDDEVSVMGYSLRTKDFRYTSWFHYNRIICLPILDVAPFDEELYDHRGEKPEDFTHLETVNLVRRPGYEDMIVRLRERLIEFIKTQIIFRGCYKDSE